MSLTYDVSNSLQGSTGTVSQSFHLEKGKSITLKNGKLTSSISDARMLIQNYCDLTLDNMVLDATEGNNSIDYVLSNNCGITLIKDSTIIAKEGGHAFDACWAPKKGYPEGAQVTVNNSKIVGDIEFDLWGENVTTDCSTTLTINSGEFLGNIVVTDIDKPNIVINGGSFTDLASAVKYAKANATIGLLSNVNLTKPLEITKSITIEGGNHSINCVSGVDRAININDNTNDVSLVINNLKIIGPTTGTYTRGISAYNNSGKLDINLNNCSVSANYYAINIAGSNTQAEVVAKNTIITGWCAAQSWSSGAKFTFDGCTLIGNNDKGYNAEGWNDFATIVINTDAVNNEFVFNNCRIEANQTTGNKQYLMSVRSSGNKVSLDGCAYFSNGTEIENLGIYLNLYPAAIDLNLTIDNEVIPIV